MSEKDLYLAAVLAGDLQAASDVADGAGVPGKDSHVDVPRESPDEVATAEAGLQTSRANLARVLERLPVAMVVAREDGTIRSFNRRAVELFGPKATSAGTFATFLEAILPEAEERRTMEGALARLRESARSGSPEPALLLTVRLPEGGERVVASDCVVVDDLVVWTASDLTDVLRLQAESARLGRIVEESLDEVYVFDATTLRFRSANRSARDNVGYTLEELRDRTPLDIKPDLTAEAFAEKLGLLRRGTARGVRFETVHQRKDGSSYPVEVHLQLSAEGGDPVFVAIIQDISVRRRAEEAIRELNAELEGRVRARTAELEEANRELESFAYSVSHDLRAPLRAMDGFAQLLVEEYGSGLDEEGLRYLSRVREGAQRMGRLVDDLLRLSRVARAELKREEVDVSALSLEVFSATSARASRSVAWRPSSPRASSPARTAASSGSFSRISFATPGNSPPFARPPASSSGSRGVARRRPSSSATTGRGSTRPMPDSSSSRSRVSTSRRSSEVRESVSRSSTGSSPARREVAASAPPGEGRRSGSGSGTEGERLTSTAARTAFQASSA